MTRPISRRMRSLPGVHCARRPIAASLYASFLRTLKRCRNMQERIEDYR